MTTPCPLPAVPHLHLTQGERGPRCVDPVTGRFLDGELPLYCTDMAQDADMQYQLVLGVEGP
jgi:hypothetical protein